jgi:hypothetical protein
VIPTKEKVASCEKIRWWKTDRFIASFIEQYNNKQQQLNNNNQTNLIRKNLHCCMCGFFDAC